MVRFGEKRSHGTGKTLLASAALFLVLLIGILAALDDLSAGTVRRQRESLERALDRCVAYCYAVEGTYPESLEYMKEHYGLFYDESRFFVDYTFLGGNMLPDYTILEKGD